MKTIICSMWDDGLETDLKLIEMLEESKIPTCFALSPNRYKNKNLANDHRDSKYGNLISKNDILKYSHFEICNHTMNHYDLKFLDKNQTKNEIETSHEMLEVIFQKEIKGFCYPYGSKNEFCDEILSNLNYTYARTTNSKNSFLDLKPTYKWNEKNLLSLLGIQNMMFWGHTYELKEEKDWIYLKRLYQKIKDHPNVELVSVEKYKEETNAF